MIDVQKEIEEHYYIGGSNISVICGLNRWKKPLTEWAELTGKIKKNFTDQQKKRMAIGVEIEDWICSKFERETGIKVRKQRQAYTDPEFPEFLKAHIDRKVEGKREIVEAKNYNWRRAKDFEDEEEIPTELIQQLNWNMGLSKCEKGYPAVFIGGNDFFHSLVGFDEEMFRFQRDMAIDFWKNYVEKEVAPMATIQDIDTLKELFPENTEEIIEIEEAQFEKFNEIISTRQSAKEQIKGFQNIVDECEVKLNEFIKEATGLETNQYRYTWKKQTRTYPDTKKMKEAGIFEKYSYISSFRVPRVKELKQDE